MAAQTTSTTCAMHLDLVNTMGRWVEIGADPPVLLLCIRVLAEGGGCAASVPTVAATQTMQASRANPKRGDEDERSSTRATSSEGSETADT